MFSFMKGRAWSTRHLALTVVVKDSTGGVPENGVVPSGARVNALELPAVYGWTEVCCRIGDIGDEAESG